MKQRKLNVPTQTMMMFGPLLAALREQTEFDGELNRLAHEIGHRLRTADGLRFSAAVAAQITLWENWREAAISFVVSSQFHCAAGLSCVPDEMPVEQLLSLDGAVLLERLLGFVQESLNRTAGVDRGERGRPVQINPCVTYDVALLVWEKVHGVLLVDTFIKDDNTGLRLPEREAVRYRLAYPEGPLESELLLAFPKLTKPEPEDWYPSECVSVDLPRAAGTGAVFG